MIAYLDLVAGASGDMLLAALLDAGADEEFVRKQLASVDSTIELRRDVVFKRGIRASAVTIAGGSAASTYPQAMSLIEGAGLDEQVERTARGILLRLFRAEADVHGTELEQVHLHEISAVDTIGDAVGVAAAIDSFEIEAVVCSPVPLGGGTVETNHGTLPVPVPAVLEILRGVPTRSVDIQAELVTPTGAAILAEIVRSFGPIPSMTLDQVGAGAGTHELEIPNILRVIVGDPISAASPLTTESLIEANVDDLNPEIYQYAIERLFAAGATDVWIVPAIGKRGRPLSVLSAIAPSSLVGAIRDVLIAETSTIGVRVTEVARSMLERHMEEVTIEGHIVRIKVATEADRVVNAAPELADCAEVARRASIPLKDVFRLAMAEWSREGGRERI